MQFLKFKWNFFKFRNKVTIPIACRKFFLFFTPNPKGGGNKMKNKTFIIVLITLLQHLTSFFSFQVVIVVYLRSNIASILNRLLVNGLKSPG